MDPPKRERKRVINYAENEYFRQAMKTGGRTAAGGPRLPKMPALQDFQFYDTARLLELYDKEQAHEVFKHAAGQREAAARAQVRARMHVCHLPVMAGTCTTPAAGAVCSRQW